MTVVATSVRLDGSPADMKGVSRAISALRSTPGPTSTHSMGPFGMAVRSHVPGMNPSLATIAVSSGIVCGGDIRIDNTDELVRGLELEPPGPPSAAALAIEAYRQWGPDFPSRLRGDFGIVLWDGQKGQILCATDHFGVRPLYFATQPGAVFAVSSDVDGVLAMLERTPPLNEARVADYLVNFFEDPRATLYEGIERLPAGSFLLAPAPMVERQYWRLELGDELRLESDSAYDHALRDLFTNVVEDRLRGLPSMAVDLSGGLDSSSIVAVSQLLLAASSTPLRSYSAIYDRHAVSDERVHIASVLRACPSVRPTFVYPGRISPLGNQAVWNRAEPIWNPQVAIDLAIYDRAAQDGMSWKLDGWGGDQTLSHGMYRLAEMTSEGHVVNMLREASLLAANRIGWLTTSQIAFRWGFRPTVPDLARTAVRKIRAIRPGIARETHPLRPEFAKRINLVDRMRDLHLTAPEGVGLARAEHWRDVRDPTNQFVLGNKERTARMFGIEPRFPYFDRILVEHCLSVPSDRKLRDGYIRYGMRSAMDGLLPPTVQWRGDKADLSPSFNENLRSDDRVTLEETAADPGELGAFVDQTLVRSECNRFLGGEESDGFRAWGLSLMRLWLNRL